MFPIFDTNLSIHCEPTHQSLCPLPSKKWKQLRTIEVTIPQGFSKLWLSLARSFLLFYFLLHPGRWPHSTLWYCNKSVHKDAFWQLYYRWPLILRQIWDVQKLVTSLRTFIQNFVKYCQKVFQPLGIDEVRNCVHIYWLNLFIFIVINTLFSSGQHTL